MKKLKKPLIILSILFLVSSCVSKRKIEDLKKMIEAEKQVEKIYADKIAKLDELRTTKNMTGELDDNSNKSLTKIIEKERNKVNKRTDSLKKMNEMLSSNKRIKIKDFKRVASVVTISKNEGQIIKSETIDFVDDLLKQKTFIKFNTASFFDAGGYEIAQEKLDEAKVVFSPVIESLFSFVNKYPNIKLNSSIVASGYADGQGFGAGELVDKLTALIGKETATKEELNSQLSKLRAEEVSSILSEIHKDKTQNLPNNINYKTSFYSIGKGEELPNKIITDYQLDDERRRVVIIYWSAVPE